MRNQPPRAMTVAGLRRVGVAGEHLGSAHPELARRSRCDSGRPSRGPRRGARRRRRPARRCRGPSRTDRRRCWWSPSAPRSSRRCASRGSRRSAPCPPRRPASPRRRRSTPAGSTTRRCRAVSARARAMAMKKVGGPARKEMRSRATRASACSGSKRRTSTERRPAAPGTRTPLSSPEMWAIGAGIEHRVGRAEPVDPGHQRRLPAQAALGVQHRLGDAGRARGEEDQRDVGGPAGEGAGRHRGAADGVGQRGGVGERLGVELQDEGGVDLAEGRRRRPPRRTSAGPAPPRRRCASRPGSGRRPPGCWGPARPPPRRAGRPGPAARRPPWPPVRRPRPADSRVAPSTTSPPCAVSRASRVGTSQGPPGRR